MLFLLFLLVFVVTDEVDRFFFFFLEEFFRHPYIQINIMDLFYSIPVNFISDNKDYKKKEGIYNQIMRENKKNTNTQRELMKSLKKKSKTCYGE